VALSEIPRSTRKGSSYQDLEIWQRAVDLASAVYSVTEHFPSSERFGLVAQMRRAAVSVPANIAEGWGRGSRLDYVRFLTIARGSLYDLVPHAIVAERVGFVGDSDGDMLARQTETLSRMLLSYFRSMQND